MDNVVLWIVVARNVPDFRWAAWRVRRKKVGIKP
jgi:hypothetical protein